MAGWRRTTETSTENVDAWSFYRELIDQDRARLSRVEREVAAICDLRQEVNSGGFDSYFRYRGGDSALVALDALPRVLGEEWACVLREGMALLGPGYPEDTDEREQRLSGIDIGDAFHALDERYYELEAATDADSRVSAHLATG